jgi:DNA-binding NarL/FixJ family response regulator
MSWHTLPPTIRTIAEQHLTPKQVTILRLQLNGLNTRAIARQLNISRSTVDEHIDAAHRNLYRHGIRHTTDGTWYLEETA